MTALMKYKLRLKHKKHEAYREAVVIAPGVYVAALWYKDFCKSDVLPLVVEKNNKAYSVRGGSKAYRRGIKLQNDELKKKANRGVKKEGDVLGSDIELSEKEKRLNKKQKEYLEEKNGTEIARSMKMFHLCSLVSEEAYKEIE